jgi:hypothetical protein
LTGHLIGPFWNIFVKNIGDFKYIMVAVLVILSCIVLLKLFYRKIFN